MKTDIILPHLHRLTSEQTGPHQPVQSWLWLRPDGNIVIDPAADITATGVTDILITHVQAENIAGYRQFPNARLHIPAGDEFLCRGRAEFDKLITKWVDPWEWETRGNFPGHMGGAINERPLPDPVPLAEPLAPGTTFRGARILATPGHGKHSVTLVAVIDGQRVAFAGDLICQDGQLWNWFDSEWDYGPQTGQRRLHQSVRELAREPLDLICPTHGAIVREPAAALPRLDARLTKVLNDEPAGPPPPEAANPVAPDSPVPGFRQLLPALHQYNVNFGNCSVLVSRTGNALLIDDGLCCWKPLPERGANHRQVIRDLKQRLGLKRIEVVIPSHYHGDHTENIPELVALEGPAVVSLDVVADPIEFPERYAGQLSCLLPWYDAGNDAIKIDRRLASGQHFHWHEFDLELFLLAGQTYYHAGIDVVIDGQRVLFVGDGPSAVSLVCEPPLCYNDAEPEHRGWAFALDRMAEHKPDLLVYGHAGYQWQPLKVLPRKQALWRQRIQDFHALSARPDLREFFDPFL